MKKLLALILMLTLLVCVATACNKDKGDTPSTDPSDQSGVLSGDSGQGNSGTSANTPGGSGENKGDGSGDNNGDGSGDNNGSVNTGEENGNTPTDPSQGAGQNQPGGSVDNPGQPGGADDGSCEHTYSYYWSYNSSGHWHRATCEHETLKADYAAHIDVNEDSKCDVCSYTVVHVHTFSSEWSSNVTHHWKNATCTHVNEKNLLGAHTDTDKNGACDDCGAHVHVVNAYGKCTVCNQQIYNTDLMSVGEVVDIAYANRYKVVSGTVSEEVVAIEAKSNTDTANPYDALFIQSTMRKSITYKLGTAAAYYRIEGTAVNNGHTSSELQENWYELLDSGKVFGVYSLNSGAITPGTASESDLSGYYLVASTLANAHGAEQLFYTLYELSKDSSAIGYEEDFDKDRGLYVITFGYLKVNTGTAEEAHADYFELEIYIGISEGGVLTYLEVVCNCYTNSLDYEDELENELNNDYYYDPITNTVSMKETAIPDTYTFKIEQREGERTYVSEYPRSYFVPADFDLYSDSSLSMQVGESVSLTVGTSVRLYLGNCTPSTASVSFMSDAFCAASDSSQLYCSVNPISSSVLLLPKAAGTYTVEISVGDVVKTLTVVAQMPEPDVEDTPTENSVKVYITDTYAWVDVASFTATVDGDYTFTIEKGVYLGAMCKGQGPWADFNNKDRDGNPKGGSITVSLKAGEKFEFYVMSDKKNINVYIPYTISEYTGAES